MPIGLVHDPIFQDHDPGSFHPESPQRLVAADKALRAWPGFGSRAPIPLREATEEELLRVHQPAHLKRVLEARGRSVSLDPDTSTSSGSVDAALMAAGGLINLCDAVIGGQAAGGLALVRPPGHHATPNRAMGFCLLNNIAVAAAHLVKAQGLERVLIVDWDVHHGNGTEDIFFSQREVLYFSTHQSPFYPGTGQVGAAGRGQGEGFNVNLPLPAGQGDHDLVRGFEDLLLPIARQYQPQFVLVSAGFDAHREDPLGGMNLSDDGYAALTQVLMEICQEFCPGKIALTLEGGYSPEAQARSLVACLEVMSGSSRGRDIRRAAGDHPRGEPIQSAMSGAARFWDLG